MQAAIMPAINPAWQEFIRPLTLVGAHAFGCDEAPRATTLHTGTPRVKCHSSLETPPTVSRGTPYSGTSEVHSAMQVRQIEPKKQNWEERDDLRQPAKRTALKSQLSADDNSNHAGSGPKLPQYNHMLCTWRCVSGACSCYQFLNTTSQSYQDKDWFPRYLLKKYSGTDLQRACLI